MISFINGLIDVGCFHIDSLVEKPKLEEAPSSHAIMGRYVLRPQIFEILETQAPGAGGEIQLTDAIKELNEKQMVVAYEFSGVRHDVGDKFGFIRAQLDFALEREDLREQIVDYMEQLVEKSKATI